MFPELTPEGKRTILLDDQTDGFFGLPWDGPIRGYYFNAYDEGRFPDPVFRPLLMDVFQSLCRSFEAVNYAETPLACRTAFWTRRRGLTGDRFYTLSQGADMELAHLLYDRPMVGLLLHMVYCYPAIPFPTASADALAAGTAAHQPAILLDYDAPIQRLYLTIDTRTVDMVWVRRELDAACRERGLLFSDDLTIPSENL